MTLATLDQVAPPSDAIRCDSWDDDGQRSFAITEPVELDADGYPLSVRVGGAQDFTGSVERRVVLVVGGRDCELSAVQVEGLVAALRAAVSRLNP